MERLAGFPPDGFVIKRFEVAFGIPVFITRDQERQIHELVSAIVDAPCNQPKDGVHWPSGSGSKPQWSRADAAFLGVEADESAPASGEPTFDDDVFFIETTARPFVSEEERERVMKQRGA